MYSLRGARDISSPCIKYRILASMWDWQSPIGESAPKLMYKNQPPCKGNLSDLRHQGPGHTAHSLQVPEIDHFRYSEDLDVLKLFTI